MWQAYITSVGFGNNLFVVALFTAVRIVPRAGWWLLDLYRAVGCPEPDGSGPSPSLLCSVTNS